MPFQDQLVDGFYNFFNHGCEDDINGGYYQPTNIGSAVTLSLDNPSYQEGNCLLSSSPLLPSSVDPLIPSEYSDAGYKQEDYGHENNEAWRTKPVKSWESIDIIHWINSEAREIKVCCTEMGGDKFGTIDGSKIYYFTKGDFLSRDEKYGHLLFDKLQKIKERRDLPRQTNYEQLVAPLKSIKYESGENDIESENIKYEAPVLTCLENKKETTTPTSYQCTPNPSNSATIDDDMKNSEPESPPSAPPQTLEKKRPGRPKGPSKRKKKPEKLGRLWEFLRDLLKNKEYCPSLIVWDNYEEGMFRFVHSDKVAKLWGTKKDNPDMNYEKLSRAMRYYYKSQVLQPVYGRRLVYKFGPTATGWQVENPNFRD